MKGRGFGALRSCLGVVWLLCAACAGRAKPPVASTDARAKAPAADSTQGLTYRLSEGAPALVLDEQGTRGVLLDDRRFTISSAGRVTLAAMQAPHLMPPVPLPARFGGGFLFWTADAAYRARSFNADLELIAPLPTNAVGFDFGPESVLITGEENWRRQYTLAGKRSPLSPPNLIDIVASDDGRSLAIDAAGRVWATTDQGHTWKSIERALSAPLRALHAAPSEAWLELANGRQLSLAPSGELLDRPAPPSDARRALSESTRTASDVDFERIASSGALLGPARALVVGGNQFSIVELPSGKVSQSPKPIGAPGEQCEALASEPRAVFVCVAEAGQVRVLSGAAEQVPTLEKTFEQEPALWFSGGALLVEAACSGAREAGRVCIRSNDGSYAEYDVAEAFAKSGVPEPRVVRWVPGAGRAPVALLLHFAPDGSALNAARLTLGHGAAVPLDAALPALFRERRVQVSTEASSHWYAKHVESSFTQLADGSLRGFSQLGALRISATGHVVLDPHRLSALGQHSGRAFGQTADGHFFQTLDFGEHWLEVAGPATDSSAAFSYDCSEAGCFLGHWSRIGWPEEPPLGKASERPVPAAIEEAVLAPVADLRCDSIGKPTLAAHPNWQQESETYLDSSGGPATDRGLSGAVRAAFDGLPSASRSAAGKAPQASTLSLSFSEAFDPSASPRRATLSKRQWLAAWKKQGERMPSRGHARPILGARLGHSVGELLTDDADIAFSASVAGKLLPLPAAGPCEFCSGYTDARGKLWLAVSKAFGATALFAADTGKVLFRLPAVYLPPPGNAEPGPARRFLPPVLGFANSDAIAVDSKGGLAILRLPSGAEPPGGDAPALLLSADSEPVALAPWSTLELASSARCTQDSAGYRALLQTPYPWLTALGYSPHDENVFALVRWGRTRVCLEALEIPVSFAALHREPPPELGGGELTLVARFVGASPGAAAVFTNPTLQYRQALSCSLVVPSHD